LLEGKKDWYNINVKYGDMVARAYAELLKEGYKKEVVV